MRPCHGWTSPCRERGGILYAYIARQPILNPSRETVGYELLYRNGSGNAAHITDGDAATRGVLTEAVTVFGLRQLTDGLPAYINFTRNLILSDYARQSDPKDIVVQVMEHVRPDEALERKLRQLRQSGYTLALKNYQERSEFRRLLSLFHIIRVDFTRTNVLFQRDAVRNHGAPGARFLADKVETELEFSGARAMGYELFQGYFFEKPFCLFKQLPPLSETPYGKLLSALLEPTPDISACAALIHKDPMLSYMFRREEKALRLPSGPLSTNIRISIYRMGPPRFLRWACLALMRQHNVTDSKDIIRRAYQRGLFMEALSASSGDGDTIPGHCFLLGVFSLLDKVTGSSLEHLFRGMALPRSMREALLGRGENGYNRLLRYAVIYEMGNERLILPDIHSRLTRDEIVSLYLRCMTETDTALARMEEPV
ncbi:MAG: EAL domain-containing protein [Oscillibacter sp.]|nr:EAL domain-containing protein [Oscillibacter sp.]